MIILTGMMNNPVFVSAEHVTSIVATEVSKPTENPFEVGEKQTVTIVVCGEDANTVKESPEEVARKILEYKLAMATYPAALTAGDVGSARFERSYINRLAGLEE